jgi:hypothetical protein
MLVFVTAVVGRDRPAITKQAFWFSLLLIFLVCCCCSKMPLQSAHLLQLLRGAVV